MRSVRSFAARTKNAGWPETGGSGIGQAIPTDGTQPDGTPRFCENSHIHIYDRITDHAA